MDGSRSLHASTGKVETVLAVASWLACLACLAYLACLANSRPMRDPESKKGWQSQRNKIWGYPLSSTCMRALVHLYPHTTSPMYTCMMHT